MSGVELGDFVVQFLGVWFDWPPITALIIIFFLTQFKEPLIEWFDGISHVKHGDTELQRQSALAIQEPNPGSLEMWDDEEDIEAEQEEAFEEDSVAELREALRKSSERLTAERVSAAYWEFKYLNLALVFRTKLLLNNLLSRGNPVKFTMLDSQMKDYGIDLYERNAMIEALLTSGLIDLDDESGLLSVNSKGEAFLRWYDGVLPPNSPLRLTGRKLNELAAKHSDS